MGRPKEFDRDQVVGRALDVFWSGGYGATSLDDLTAAMGLGRGSLYNEFGDKHTLFLEALDRYRADRVMTLRAILGSTPSARQGVERALRATVDVLWTDERRRGCLMVNSIAELAAVDPAVRERARDSFGLTAQAFREILERGKAAGEIGTDLDPLATSSFLASAVYTLRLLAKVSDRSVANHVVEVTLRAIS